VKELSSRFAGESDIQILTVFNRELIEAQKHRNSMDDNQLRKRMLGWLSSDEYKAVLFDLPESSQIEIGYALFQVRQEDIYLRQFLISQNFQRSGFGTKAFEMLKRDYWPQGKRVTVETLSNNPRALGFWRSLGFHKYSIQLELEAEAH
tara:strand:+ start:222 stop:668 length:447 start_codon:yes stop_codon:yes gene_type:complete